MDDHVNNTCPNLSGFYIVPFLILLGVLAVSTNIYAEDLIESYQQAVVNSPALARSQALLDAERAAEPLARSALLPRLDLAAGISRNKVDMTGVGLLQVNETYTGDAYSVTLRQPLFNGPAYLEQDVAEARIHAGQAALQVTSQALALQVTESYFNILKARANLKVAENQQELLLTILDQAETAREVGTGDILAVYESSARVDAAAADLVLAENAERIARQSLQNLTHRPVGPLADLGEIAPELPQPDRVEPWIEAALKQHPGLRKARMDLQAAKDRVGVAKRTRWPRLTLDAGYSHTEGGLLPDMDRDELTAALNLRIPLYQGGEIGAKTEQARALANVSYSSFEFLRDQVQLETETAFFNLQSSVANLNAASRALESAQTSLDAAREGYRVGVRSMLDLLTVIQNFTSSERNYYTALYDHMIARVRLKAAVGILAVEDLESINGLLQDGAQESALSERNG